MAMWFHPSQLLLIALLSWNVHSFPAKNSWSWRSPDEGSFTNMEMPPGYSFQSAPALPSSAIYPAVSFPYEGVNTSPVTYPASPTPDMSSIGSQVRWVLPTPAWDPVEESATPYTESRTSQPIPDSLPPPLFQAGELDTYELNSEIGNSEHETEESSLMPPPPPYPEPDFQPGELSKYNYIFEHGNAERETEQQGYMPQPPYASAAQGAEELSSASMSELPTQPVSGKMQPLDLNYYLFLTGQLPPGTLTHFQKTYESGIDDWAEDHYEGYDPMAESPTIPTQTKEFPSDGLWQQPQFYSKA
ncbi:uncharacterized protein LOC127350742 [Dicentrarchus labrax]|uniref:uncharacterized protein LOC127350742 n=1 Tax=Dicentrarchus labrax TaxID=13489 RepID=UPI0021F51AD6|nr:uncharacterized protein LOC127350742 [Dicentrarchus labrax]